MEIIECDRCGEEYPRNWGYCPFCDIGEKPNFKFDEEETWN